MRSLRMWLVAGFTALSAVGFGGVAAAAPDGFETIVVDPNPVSAGTPVTASGAGCRYLSDYPVEVTVETSWAGPTTVTPDSEGNWSVSLPAPGLESIGVQWINARCDIYVESWTYAQTRVDVRAIGMLFGEASVTGCTVSIPVQVPRAGTYLITAAWIGEMSGPAQVQLSAGPNTLTFPVVRVHEYPAYLSLWSSDMAFLDTAHGLYTEADVRRCSPAPTALPVDPSPSSSSSAPGPGMTTIAPSTTPTANTPQLAATGAELGPAVGVGVGAILAGALLAGSRRRGPARRH